MQYLAIGLVVVALIIIVAVFRGRKDKKPTGLGL